MFALGIPKLVRVTIFIHKNEIFSNGYGPQVIEHSYDNDLKYAMRASGGSFGIITEFVYKMYPKPETMSCLLFIFIENEYDFKKLNKAAQDGRYAVTVFEPVFLRRPKQSHVVSLVPFCTLDKKFNDVLESIL